MALHSLFVDFNSYFASVEQQVEPSLRGRPVGVVPTLTDSTCCIAASYEAKKFGIKTGTMVAEARKCCPEIEFVTARHAIYIEYHHKLVAAVEACTHVEEVVSIDEMVCSLTGKWQKRETALALAVSIKQNIARTVGEYLPCSIGIAPNHFLAKTATDMQKPDGLVVIDLEDLPDCLHSLQLRDFCGIGKKMEYRLHQHGIVTVEQLCSVGKPVLRRVWNGIEGERFYEGLHGEQVTRPLPGKSVIGHSQVLEPRLRTAELAFGVLHRLLQKAAMRMRKIGYLAGGMHLSTKSTGGHRWSEEIRFIETDDTVNLLHHLRQVWEKRSPELPPPMAVAVNLFHLVAADNVTPSFFENPARGKLNQLVDSLNEKFGKDTVYFAGAHQALDSAPMRIAFTRIPDLSEEKLPEEAARLMQARSERDARLSAKPVSTFKPSSHA